MPPPRRPVLPVTPRSDRRAQRAGRHLLPPQYRGSWAQTYLTDRLGGTDLTGDPRTRPGYAPAGWTALTGMLRRHGATDEELLTAGLTNTSTGRLIDTFRDRLVLPIEHHGQVVGFVGRRNPDTDHLEAGTDAAVKAGPKYLNTAETVLFAKGDQLYGMDPYTDRLPPAPSRSWSKDPSTPSRSASPPLATSASPRSAPR